ncbi:hypothetical protein G9A89_002913 [Geosiphon pyriformis]|nr:hypothetical protein G9A89_002913 [Geosiphon pyriformis]
MTSDEAPNLTHGLNASLMPSEPQNDKGSLVSSSDPFQLSYPPPSSQMPIASYSNDNFRIDPPYNLPSPYNLSSSHQDINYKPHDPNLEYQPPQDRKPSGITGPPYPPDMSHIKTSSGTINHNINYGPPPPSSPSSPPPPPPSSPPPPTFPTTLSSTTKQEIVRPLLTNEVSKQEQEHWPPPPNYQNPSLIPQKHYPPQESTIIEMGFIPENNPIQMSNSLQTDKAIRMAFVRKVYFLLSAQLAVTIGISIWFRQHSVVKEWVSDHQWLFFVSWALALIILCLLFWKRKSFPLNLFFLFLFTLCISYGIGTVVSVYDTTVVLQAFLITFGTFIALVLFTLQSKIDFSSWGPFLYAGLWVIIFAGFIGWLFPFDRGYHIAVSGLSALLFSGYIIYDTYMIFNKLSPEEYILAAIDLYLDILNLFIAILALLGGADGH